MHIITAFIPTLLYGIVDTISVGVSKRVPTLYFVLLQNSLTALLFAVSALLVVPTPLFSSSNAIYALLGGFALVGGFMFFLKGLSVGKAGIITTIAHGYILISVIIGMIWFGDSAAPPRLLGVALVMIGITMLSLRWRDLKNFSLKATAGVGYAFLAMVGWGVGYAFQNIAAETIPLFEAALLVELGALIVPVTGFFIIKRNSLRRYRTFTRYDIGAICFIAIAFFATQITLITAFKYLDLGLVTTIAGSSSIITALLAYWFYGQRLSLPEVLGIIITIAGLTLLGLFA